MHHEHFPKFEKVPRGSETFFSLDIFSENLSYMALYAQSEICATVEFKVLGCKFFEKGQFFQKCYLTSPDHGLSCCRYSAK